MFADPVLANARGDFVPGVNDGDPAILAAAGSGTWRYLASDTADLSLDPTLELLTWDATGNRWDRPTTGGSLNVVALGIGGITATELGMHPSATSRPPSFVAAQWTAGPNEAGIVHILGNVRLTDVNGSGSVTFDLFVDGVSLISTVLNDLVGIPLDETVMVGVGSTVDFVVGANGADTFDSTGLDATIRGVPEPLAGLLLTFGLVLLYRRRR